MRINLKNSLYMIFNVLNMLIYLIFANEEKVIGVIFFVIVFFLHIMTIYTSQKKKTTYQIFTEYGRYVPLYELLMYYAVFIVAKQLGNGGIFVSSIIFALMLSKFLVYFILANRFEARMSIPKDKAQSNLILFSRIFAVLCIGITVFAKTINFDVSNVSMILGFFIMISILYGSEYVWYLYLFNTRKEKLGQEVV